MPGTAVATRRIRARVTGTVQGVGFRPYVYRLCEELELSGFVFNDDHGVVIEAEGASDAIDRLLARLKPDAPPLAVVERVSQTDVARTGESGFSITTSDSASEPAAAVAPDTAPCDECLAELNDPRDRRYRYPFINCTNCGPRFTIVRGVPYDRALTTMAHFEMCGLCRAEYEDPANRRFHAEPNACPECGPRVWITDPSGGDPIDEAAAALFAGEILAVKGIGGFHLACRAADHCAVSRLRARKHREDKPFAIMAPDLGQARRLVGLTPVQQQMLTSRERPIVIGARAATARVSHAVAPRNPELGVMLPYSPLHHLLLAAVGEPLVMTSGNVSDEPIAFRDEDALERLGDIAERFLLHDRPIETRTDDSVVRVVSGRRQILRRSRGLVPASIPLGLTTSRPLLACGAEQKSTFCVAKDGRAWVSHHIGDLENYETLTSFTEGIAHFERLFGVEPAIVAHDLHPDYLSTKYALDRCGVELVGVQHHHAHLAACLAEHSRTEAALGAIFDGTGYGTDGAVWGGELLFGDLRGFERVGHLPAVRLPGGAAAVRQPWRMACSWLAAAYGEPQPLPPAFAGRIDERSWRQVSQLVMSGLASPQTTSAGRLFDAVAALCGIRSTVNYEGQAAIELEAICAAGEEGVYETDGLDFTMTVRALCADLAAGVAVPRVAARFHNSFAAATAAALLRAAADHDAETAVLSGGVFQNRRLVERTTELLLRGGMEVLTPQLLPPNDGGIAYGQAAIAAAHR